MTKGESRHEPSSRTAKINYVVYCGSCHGRKEDGEALYLSLNNIEAISNYTGGGGRTVRSMLDGPNYIMPPSGSLMPSVQERKEMLQLLDGGHPGPDLSVIKVRAEMRSLRTNP